MLQLCYFELNKCLSEKSVIIHTLILFLSNNNPKAGRQAGWAKGAVDDCRATLSTTVCVWCYFPDEAFCGEYCRLTGMGLLGSCVCPCHMALQSAFQSMWHWHRCWHVCWCHLSLSGHSFCIRQGQRSKWEWLMSTAAQLQTLSQLQTPTFSFKSVRAIWCGSRQ